MHERVHHHHHDPSAQHHDHGSHGRQHHASTSSSSIAHNDHDHRASSGPRQEHVQHSHHHHHHSGNSNSRQASKLVVVLVVFLYNVALRQMTLSYLLPPEEAEGDAQVFTPTPQPAGDDHQPMLLACKAAHETNTKRRSYIVEMTRRAWAAFYKNAAGFDELLPLTGNGTNSWGDIGITAVDSLDTLLLMELHDEFEEAKAIALNIDLSQAESPLSIFETVIRHLGAYLAVFAATRDKAFLDRAVHVGQAFLPAYQNAPNHLPPVRYFAFGGEAMNFKRESGGGGPGGGPLVLAEIGSTQLEMRYLSALTGNPAFGEESNFFTQVLRSHRQNGWPTNESLYEEKAPRMPHKGLWGPYVDERSLKVSGAGGWHGLMDSVYEYFLKQWILFGKDDVELLEMYEDAVEAVMLHLVKYGRKRKTAVLGYASFDFLPAMDDLVCFTPGTLILGVMHGAHSWPGRQRNWSASDVADLAEDLLATCFRQYRESATGIGPANVVFNPDGSYNVTSPRYYLRPETIESIFYFYRYSHDQRYREWGWEIAQAIDRHCYVSRTEAYAALKDSTQRESITGGGIQMNSMESFFIAEVLKYLFLLFSDEHVLPLDQFVFTTEAHPLPIRKPTQYLHPVTKGKKHWSGE